MLKTMAQRLLLATTVCCAVTATAVAQAHDPPPSTAYDDEMLCRFVLDAVSTPLPRGADPSEIANNTGIGGYYWATQYNDYGEPVA